MKPLNWHGQPQKTRILSLKWMCETTKPSFEETLSGFIKSLPICSQMRSNLRHVEEKSVLKSFLPIQWFTRRALIRVKGLIPSFCHFYSKDFAKATHLRLEAMLALDSD